MRDSGCQEEFAGLVFINCDLLFEMFDGGEALFGADEMEPLGADSGTRGEGCLVLEEVYFEDGWAVCGDSWADAEIGDGGR